MNKGFTIVFLLLCIFAFNANALAQSPSREDVLRQIEDKRAELQKLEEQFLAPSQEDRNGYAEFLRQPDTGLIRLLPREVYESDTYKSNKKTLTVRGGGAYYSFARLTHEYGYGSDIELQQGYLSVGFAGADYGMLTELEDVSIAEITADHPAVRFMSEYAVPNQEPRARSEYRRFATGATIDAAIYKTHLPAKVHSTYLLRSINYSDSDVLVAFYVVRKDTDGSLIIAWKLLKKYPKPELARNSKPESAR
jgi:hypothetical protein